MKKNVKLSEPLLKEMKQKAGYRERTVIDKYRDGTATIEFKQNGDWIQFYYSPEEEYQDANGATFDLQKRRWIG